MLDWFFNLGIFEQTAYGTAFISTALLILKLAFDLIGIGGSPDAAEALEAAQASDCTDLAMADAGAAQYLSALGILSFFTVGSWVSILMFSISSSVTLAVIIGIIAGAVQMKITVRIMNSLKKLQESGNVNLNNAIGKIGEVYLTIPPADQGEGQVNIIINDAIREYQAVSLDQMPIPTGTKVRVIDIVDEMKLIVQRESEELE